jgi:hypothetical protein
MRNKAEVEAQLAKFRQRLADIVAQHAEYNTAVPATVVSFDTVCNLREEHARVSGYIAALEFALDF